MFVYLIAIAFLTGAAGAYWNRPEETSYITEDVVRKNIEKVVNATGEVRAIELVTVGAQVSGKIEKLYVTIGQTVKKGEMIAEIDSTTQQNDVDINKAKLSSYEAQLTAAKTSLNIAEKQYKRLQNLKKNVMPPQMKTLKMPKKLMKRQNQRWRSSNLPLKKHKFLLVRPKLIWAIPKSRPRWTGLSYLFRLKSGKPLMPPWTRRQLCKLQI